MRIFDFYSFRLPWLHGVRLLLSGVLFMFGAPVQAQSCWNSGSTGLAFGAATAGAATDVQGSVGFQCQGVYGSITYVRMCVYIAEGSPIGGIAPRWMTNNNGAQMKYDIYSDAARSQVIGPPPAGGGFPLYSLMLQVPNNSSAGINIPLYGRIPAGQNLPATQAFQSQIQNSQIRWAASSSAYPTSCDAGASTGTVTFYLGATATFSNSCSIAIGGATGMDFGSAQSLATATDATSTISLSCPLNTSWKVGLNDGAHAVAGQRRMASPAPEFLNYELYLDSGRTRRWGNDTAGGTNTASGSGTTQANPTVLNVYGRLPAQTTGPPATYTDTVTVTLTY